MNGLKVHSLFIVFFLISLASICQNINIQLLSSLSIKNFEFIADSGKYDLISDNKLIGSLQQNEKCSFEVRKNKIKAIAENGSFSGNYSEIQIRGRKQTDIFILESKDKQFARRRYDNDLYVNIDKESLKLINDVNFEKYIAGVVESEGGSEAPLEYYKTQAILCRTYSLKHYDKHLESGFNLCDDVHCQAYKGRCEKNRMIYSAAIETAGLVIVDEQLRIISATFFANSGGETANSEDVWQNQVSYLRSIPDSYSLNQPGSIWEKSISIEQWNKYLESKQIVLSGNNNDLKFEQKSRKKNYTYNQQDLPLKAIRSDWGLRSTFFSIEVSGENIILKGKGYGHGVGLSQEGAMQMARQGFNYESIIDHYFTKVKIMSIKSLDFFQIE